jgi:hypothetical protein
VAAFPSSMLTYDAFSFTQATFLLFVLMALASIILMLPPTPQPHGEPAPEDPAASLNPDVRRRRARQPLPAGPRALALIRAESDGAA